MPLILPNQIFLISQTVSQICKLTVISGDNLTKAIRFATRQLIDLIPKIYDTERIARIVGVDGS